MRKLSPAVAAVTASLALVGGAGVARRRAGRGKRVVYPGNGAAPQVQVSSTGNGCKALRAPASAPSIRPYKPRIPHTLQVHYEVPTAPLVRPLQVAELGD